MSGKAEYRGSLDYCRETCPDVDVAFHDAWTALEELLAPSVRMEARSHFNDLIAKVKEVGTEKLRDALCTAVRDKLDAEGERDDLQKQVDSLQSEVDDLQEQARALEAEGVPA